MSPRRSPYRHNVRNHFRNGFPVKSYKRGEGVRTRKRSQGRRVVGTPKKGRKSQDIYDITVGYSTGIGDRFKVDASSFLGAIDQGISKASKAPKFIHMRRGTAT